MSWLSWVIVFSIITIWFILGWKITTKPNAEIKNEDMDYNLDTEKYSEFLRTEAYKRLSSITVDYDDM